MTAASEGNSKQGRKARSDAGRLLASFLRHVIMMLSAIASSIRLSAPCCLLLLLLLHLHRIPCNAATQYTRAPT